ncbi:hypothetical protein I79_000360 [Cricetulus griseus]|uniref:Uncharacterized protein n=1 Tax=Cricetulus griseus TaxID=10029 RepID=G3GS50_CRIGR|nr:hypothetical protein I79_000360 [Cricetulus griseus]
MVKSEKILPGSVKLSLLRRQRPPGSLFWDVSFPCILPMHPCSPFPHKERRNDPRDWKISVRSRCVVDNHC